MLVFRPSRSFPGFDSPEGFKVSFLNYCIMVKSKFSDDFQELKNSKIVLLPVEVINPFVDYCNAQNVHPCGGALVQTLGGSMLQYLYL